jgi:DNA-binding transcriptional LysR family regulator
MPPRAFASDSRISLRLKLRDLQILFTVVELGSMSKAASHLAVTQPTVSEAIADLEDAVGARLLDRGPHGVALTIYGQTFLKRGLEAFDALKQGMRDVEFLAASGAGDVLIGASEVLLGGFVPAIIQRLARNHPNVIVYATEVNPSDLDFSKLRDRKVDLMLGMLAASPIDDELRAEMLFEESLSIVVGGGNQWAKRRTVALADLMEEPWIFGDPNNATQLAVSAAFRANGLKSPRIGVATQSMNLRMALLASGNYISAIPNSLLRYSADRWALKIVPVNIGVRYPVGIWTLKNRTLSPVAELFIENARAIAKSLKTPTHHA